IAMILFIALICFIANLITKKIIIRIITHVIKNNRFEWDNILLERKVFRKISHIVPAIIIYNFRNSFGENFEYLIVKGVTVYVILGVLAMMNSLLNAINDIYQTVEVSKMRPIKGFVEVVKIIMIIFAFILVIANVIGKDRGLILSGLGAL